MDSMTSRRHSAWIGRAFVALMLGWLLSGCASFYVDGNVREVASTEFAKPETVRPVQVFFEFQTKGVVNTRATDLLRDRVLKQVKDSGLFGTLVNQAEPSAGVLSITLNNVPLSDDAFTKGFVTGLTFGLAGSQVSDGYVCTATYSPPGGGAPVVKSARHAIHATLGASSAPANATKAANAEDAVFTMSRQVISQVLSDLSHDSAFAAH